MDLKGLSPKAEAPAPGSASLCGDGRGCHAPWAAGPEDSSGYITSISVTAQDTQEEQRGPGRGPASAARRVAASAAEPTAGGTRCLGTPTRLGRTGGGQSARHESQERSINL